MTENADETPLEPIYGWVDAGAGLQILREEARLDDERLGDLHVELRLLHDANPRWRLDPPGEMALGPAILRVRHPRLSEIDITAEVANSDGRGWIHPCSLGAGTGIERVVAHWINVEMILPAEGLQRDGSTWAGRWSVDAAGWRFTLDSRPDLSTQLRQARELDAQYVMTHISELEASDGRTFTGDEAAHVLHGLQLALSFALGRWVAPALPVGLDSRGDTVWEQWAPWRCDHLRGHQSWWDTHTGDDLKTFVAAFLDAFLDASQHAEVRLLAHHVIEANRAGMTSEARVMLASASLQYHAWVTLVLSGRLSGKQFKKLSAVGVLRQQLTDAGIQLVVPPELGALDELGKSEGEDAPGSLNWVRNRLVHPKVPDEPYQLEGLVWEAAQLLLEYSELLLLRRVGYSGHYSRRYPPHRWTHESELVPWATRD